MTWLQALVLAIVEGLTEFLPVSSTGHMIIASSAMGIASSQLVKDFTVVIQLGAILAVIALYKDRFFQSFQFYLRLAVGFLPAALVGILLANYIDSLLESVTTVAVALIVGGAVLLWVDKYLEGTDEEEAAMGRATVGYRRAALIGCWQCLAMIPGVSRSAASIVGGMATGLTRARATEFSFFLAVPTMAGATALKVYKNPAMLAADRLPLILLGSAVAFVVALVAMRGFVRYVARYGFRVFGIYRIVLGAAILIWLHVLGQSLHMA